MKKTTILIITLFLFLNSVAFAGTTENKALLIAAGSGDLAKVSQLISEGADVNYKNEAGFTPLMMTAMDQKKFGISMLLIGSGANIQAKNMMDDTALTYAVMGNNSQLATVLLSQGASPDIKGSSGKTARQIAKDNRNQDILTAMGESPTSITTSPQPNTLKKTDTNTVAIFVGVPSQGFEDPDAARNNIFESLQKQFITLGYEVIPLERSRTVGRSYQRENNPYNIPNFVYEFKKDDLVNMGTELNAGLVVHVSAVVTDVRFKPGFLTVSTQNTVTCDIRIIDSNSDKYLLDTNFAATGKSSSSFDKAFLRALNKALEEINLQTILGK